MVPSSGIHEYGLPLLAAMGAGPVTPKLGEVPDSGSVHGRITARRGVPVVIPLSATRAAAGTSWRRRISSASADIDADATNPSNRNAMTLGSGSLRCPGA